MGEAVVLGMSACYIAGACYFVHDTRELTELSTGQGLYVSYLMAIFWSVFYFQHKLHVLRALQQDVMRA